MTHRYALPSSTLTPREREAVLTYARLGTYSAAAREMGIRRETVRNFLRNARIKLGAVSSVQAIWLLMEEEDGRQPVRRVGEVPDDHRRRGVPAGRGVGHRDAT